MDGWGQLGANLFGGSGQAYQQGVGQSADLQTKLMRARQMAQEETARSKMAEAMLGMGASPEEAQSLATIFNAGHNPTQATGSMLDLQQRDQRGQVWEQATQPGATVAGLNPMLAALQGKPVDTTKVSGGVAYNPTTEPSMAAMFQTPQSVSESRRIEAAAVKEAALANAANARAGASGAQADASTAQAELRRVQAAAGGFRPQAPAALDPMDGSEDMGIGIFSDGSGVPQRVDLAAQPAPAGPAPRARNPKTGEVLELRGGQWVPVQ